MTEADRKALCGCGALTLIGSAALAAIYALLWLAVSAAGHARGAL